MDFKEMIRLFEERRIFIDCRALFHNKPYCDRLISLLEDQGYKAWNGTSLKEYCYSRYYEDGEYKILKRQRNCHGVITSGFASEEDNIVAAIQFLNAYDSSLRQSSIAEKEFLAIFE